MPEDREVCPACGGTALIKSGHACGRQRWRCKGCGRQFTRTTPRGKPAAMKREAVSLYCAGLPMNAIGKRRGVSAQSVMRWIRDHARDHCPKPQPIEGRASVVEIDEMWHVVEKRPASFGSGRPSRASGRLIDCECGDRDRATLDRLLARLERWGVRLSCTDDGAPYDAGQPAARAGTRTG